MGKINIALLNVRRNLIGKNVRRNLSAKIFRALSQFERTLVSVAFSLSYLTPLYHCMKPVLEMERQQPVYLLRSALRKQLGILSCLLRSGCDSLGLATWISKIPATSHVARDSDELGAWYQKNRPESLKHISRVYIQNRLGFTEVRHKYCTRKVKKMDIPESLKEYLCRRLLPAWSHSSQSFSQCHLFYLRNNINNCTVKHAQTCIRFVVFLFCPKPRNTQRTGKNPN